MYCAMAANPAKPGCQTTSRVTGRGWLFSTSFSLFSSSLSTLSDVVPSGTTERTMLGSVILERSLLTGLCCVSYRLQTTQYEFMLFLVQSVFFLLDNLPWLLDILYEFLLLNSLFRVVFFLIRLRLSSIPTFVQLNKLVLDLCSG